MTNIWILPLESVETRYTCQWLRSIPSSLIRLASQTGFQYLERVDYANNYDANNIISIIGDEAEQDTTPGAFLNFSGTNIWKSSQLVKLAEHFRLGNVKEGDRILITDAWNPAILQIKYMIDLLGFKNVKIHAIWHAGQYDPQDFLGRCLPDKTWARTTEQALFQAIDYNYYATDFHIDLFLKGVFGNVIGREIYKDDNKIIRSGQPHELLVQQLSKYINTPKENIVIFPHRIAPEKQTEIFRDLAKELPEYKFIACQDTKLTKDEYHELLAKSKVMFSASLQETLGIGAMESILVDTIPMLPDRLSYSEMYLPEFKYESNWTISYTNYEVHRQYLKATIVNLMDNYEKIIDTGIVDKQRQILLENYLTGDVMFKNILGIA